jgi:hypothetical protein
MMSANPFAREPDSMETVIATVQRSALEEPAALAASGGLVRTVAAEAVAHYWPRPIRLYIPVLALREVRAWLRDQPPISVTSETRPLHLVLAAHRFVAARPNADSGNSDFRQAAVQAAESWCGTSPERTRARSAFIRVVDAMCADGTAVAFDPGRYVMLAAEVLATPEEPQPDDPGDEESPGANETSPRDERPGEESEA